MVQEFGRRGQYEQMEDEMAAFYEETLNRQVVSEEELMEGSLVALRQGRRWHNSMSPSKVQKLTPFEKNYQPATGRL